MRHAYPPLAPPTSSELTEWFMELERSRGRYSQRITPIMRRLVEDQLYHLAQALASCEFPGLQRELTNTRREFIHHLKKHKASLNGHVFTHIRRPVERWSDHQITPEVSRDPALAGLIIPRELSRRLIRLHKQQVASITDLLARSR